MSVSVQVFDPAMCCSTGICGASVDPQLIRFAADLEWLQQSGVSIARFNLAQQPKAFAESTEAKLALESKGESALPLIVVDGVVKSSGIYPSREQLAEWTRLATTPPLFSDAASELVAMDAPAPEVAPKASSGGCCGSNTSDSRPKKPKCCC